MNDQNEIDEDVLAISCEYPLVMNINELEETKECDERIKRPFVVSSNKVKEFFSQNSSIIYQNNTYQYHNKS